MCSASELLCSSVVNGYALALTFLYELIRIQNNVVNVPWRKKENRVLLERELEENCTSELHVFLEFHKRIYNFMPEFKIHKYSCSLISCRCSVRVRPGTEGRQVHQCDG